ncbi:hypothetical protein K501DRAFT_331643 [Backusella circina FSU 941]|nr:hypothetical protein K501DRAFT_331643 [Backusella circina FSU 941]
MDLSYCLFCEKRLGDDSLVYCSLSCQANEAASTTPRSPVAYSYPSNTIQKSEQIYQISYHRRPSLCITNKAKTNYMTPSSLSTSSSSLPFSSSLSTISTSCSCENGITCVPPFSLYHQP